MAWCFSPRTLVAAVLSMHSSFSAVYGLIFLITIMYSLSMWQLSVYWWLSTRCGGDSRLAQSTRVYTDGFVQYYSISSLLALQILQSCTKLLTYFTSKDIHVYILFWWIHWSIIDLELRNQPLLTMVELISIFKKKFHSIIMSYLLEAHFVYFVSQTMGNKMSEKNHCQFLPSLSCCYTFYIIFYCYHYSYLFRLHIWCIFCVRFYLLLHCLQLAKI